MGRQLHSATFIKQMLKAGASTTKKKKEINVSEHRFWSQSAWIQNPESTTKNLWEFEQVI